MSQLGLREARLRSCCADRCGDVHGCDYIGLDMLSRWISVAQDSGSSKATNRAISRASHQAQPTEVNANRFALVQDESMTLGTA